MKQRSVFISKAQHKNVVFHIDYEIILNKKQPKKCNTPEKLLFFALLLFFCLKNNIYLHQNRRPHKTNFQKILRTLFKKLSVSNCCVFKNAQILKLENIFESKLPSHLYKIVELGKKETVFEICFSKGVSE